MAISARTHKALNVSGRAKRRNGAAQVPTPQPSPPGGEGGSGSLRSMDTRRSVGKSRAKPKPAQAAVPSSEEGNRRGDIIRAAGRLFREQGYAATTIREIADAVNMRSGSPFYHFKTKHDMLRAIVLEGINRLHEAVVQAREGVRDGSPEKIFRVMVKAHLNELLGEEGQDFAAVLLHELRHLDPETLALVVELRDRYEAMWSDILKQLKKAGSITDARSITRLFLMGAMNWSSLWYRNDGALSADQIAKELADWVLQSK